MLTHSQRSDNQIWARVFNPATSTWTGWIELKGAVTGTPTAAVRGDCLLVFAATATGEVRYHGYTEGATSWELYKELAGAVMGNLTAVRTSSDALFVYGRTSDGDLTYRFFDDGGWNDSATDWRRWWPLGQPAETTRLDSTPIATLYGSAMFVGARATDGNLYARSLSGGGWSDWTKLAGSHPDQLSSITPSGRAG